MIQSETDGQACVCPECGYRCNACLGTASMITREQLAVMLCRAMEYIAAAKQEWIPVPVPSADLSAYADSGTISEWAVQPMTDLVEMGILQGSDGNLIPQANTTVEQAVLLILRAAEYEGAVA